MALYYVTAEGEGQYVEARSFDEALNIFRAFWTDCGEDGDPLDTPVEQVALISDDDVLRIEPYAKKRGPEDAA